MSEPLYRKLKKSINYSTQNEQDELNNFILELPYALRNKMTLLIFSKKYHQLKYFQNRSTAFITWAIPKFKPQQFEKT